MTRWGALPSASKAIVNLGDSAHDIRSAQRKSIVLITPSLHQPHSCRNAIRLQPRQAPRKHFRSHFTACPRHKVKTVVGSSRLSSISGYGWLASGAMPLTLHGTDRRHACCTTQPAILSSRTSCRLRSGRIQRPQCGLASSSLFAGLRAADCGGRIGHKFVFHRCASLMLRSPVVAESKLVLWPRKQHWQSRWCMRSRHSRPCI